MTYALSESFLRIETTLPLVGNSVTPQLRIHLNQSFICLAQSQFSLKRRSRLHRPVIGRPFPLWRTAVDGETRMSERVHYISSPGKWRRCGVVEVVSLHDTLIASFPVDFLLSCGDNTWSFVLFVVQLLVIHDSEHPGAIYADKHADSAVELDRSPTEGTYRYVQSGAPKLVSPSMLQAEELVRSGHRCCFLPRS